MKIEKVFDIRFLVPPLLIVAAVFLASPTGFLSILSLTSEREWFTIGILSTFVLTSGFVISSLVEFILGFFRHRISLSSEREYKILQSRFSAWNVEFSSDSTATELAVWKALDKTSDHVREQVHKRWHIAMANFNCTMSLLLIVFIVNGWKAYISVSRIDSLLIVDQEIK